MTSMVCYVSAPESTDLSQVSHQTMIVFKGASVTKEMVDEASSKLHARGFRGVVVGVDMDVQVEVTTMQQSYPGPLTPAPY